MLDGLLAGLADFADLSRWGALLFGLILGFAAGIVPGIGGRVGLLLCLPLAVLFDPLSGAVFLLAMHSVVHTSGSVTPIAYGLPTTASEAATAIDGFQLQRQGRGAEALGASLSSSSFGGVVGALAFILAVPVVRPIVTNIGAPEFLLISLLGLVLVAALSGRHLGGGLAVAALGVLASTVGIDALTAQPRFTFGRLELWDGLQVIALVGGLFVIPEMIALAGNTEVSAATPASAELRKMLAGMRAAFQHRMIMIRSTIIGIAVGLMPGAGSSVAVWIAYADASRRGTEAVPFGSGALAGVVAPEAANNSKEGGALIPTAFFGIPGSSSMAILLGGFAMLGIHPGPSFLTTDLGTAMAFAFTVILANLLTIPLFLLVVPFIVRLVTVSPVAIVPFALLAIVTAALGPSGDLFSFLQFAAGGVFGVLLYLAGLPRAPFLLGFIIGPMVEKSLAKTLSVFGPSAIARPGVIVLGLILLVVLWRMRLPRAGLKGESLRSRPVAILVLCGMAVLGICAIMTARGFSGTSWIAPVLAAAVLVFASLFSLRTVGSEPTSGMAPISLKMGGALAVGLACVPAAGLIAGSLVFLSLTAWLFSKRPAWLIAAVVIVPLMQVGMVEGLLQRPLPFGLLGGGIFR